MLSRAPWIKRPAFAASPPITTATLSDGNSRSIAFFAACPSCCDGPAGNSKCWDGNDYTFKKCCATKPAAAGTFLVINGMVQRSTQKASATLKARRAKQSNGFNPFLFTDTVASFTQAPKRLAPSTNLTTDSSGLHMCTPWGASSMDALGPATPTLWMRESVDLDFGVYTAALVPSGWTAVSADMFKDAGFKAAFAALYNAGDAKTNATAGGIRLVKNFTSTSCNFVTASGKELLLDGMNRVLKLLRLFNVLLVRLHRRSLQLLQLDRPLCRLHHPHITSRQVTPRHATSCHTASRHARAAVSAYPSRHNAPLKIMVSFRACACAERARTRERER